MHRCGRRTLSVSTRALCRSASDNAAPSAAAPEAAASHAPPSRRGQPLFAVRSGLTAPAEAMEVWAMSTVKRDAGALRPAADLAAIVKRPSDSLLTVLLPFGSDARLRAQMVNFRGQLRVGRLLEELDSFCGNIAYAHCDDGDPGTELPTLVTASLDRLDLLKYPLLPDADLQLRGCCTYVGTSSMSIDVDVTTAPAPGAPAQPVMQMSTTFVARDKRTGGPVAVPRLACADGWETRLWEAGRVATAARRAARSAALDRVPPTPAELAGVHALFMELQAQGRGERGGVVAAGMPAVAYMSDTRLTSSELTQPQDRNMHGKVRGRAARRWRRWRRGGAPCTGWWWWWW